mmetsp:Transcript_17581/g.49482  ORF Transcript_17581/g.49482 Transcript_17581/m.49482 type:complete len:205 (-) Transcript_17581:289-903(-)
MYHVAKVRPASSTMAGTKTAEMRSARPWMGALFICAASTRRTICASAVSAPTLVASMSRLPVVFTVPPVTLSPETLRTGSGSPVIMASSTKDSPSRTSPSAGTLLPGSTRSRSPRCTSRLSTSSSRTTRPVAASTVTSSAEAGASCSSRVMASLVRPLALASSSLPSRMNVMSSPEVSKKSVGSYMSAPWWCPAKWWKRMDSTL